MQATSAPRLAAVLPGVLPGGCGSWGRSRRCFWGAGGVGESCPPILSRVLFQTETRGPARGASHSGQHAQQTNGVSRRHIQGSVEQSQGSQPGVRGRPGTRGCPFAPQDCLSTEARPGPSCEAGVRCKGRGPSPKGGDVCTDGGKSALQCTHGPQSVSPRPSKHIARPLRSQRLGSSYVLLTSIPATWKQTSVTVPTEDPPAQPAGRRPMSLPRWPHGPLPGDRGLNSLPRDTCQMAGLRCTLRSAFPSTKF